ncbi:MAG: phytase [Bacteroidales bacterium]|nr:phytase [Bacteroidales bacterium]
MKNYFVLVAIVILVQSCSKGDNFLHVPKDYATISAAVEAASMNDTIIVARGKYFENILVNKPITIASRYILTGDREDIGRTIIDGQAESVFTAEGFSGQTFTLIGLTIQNGDDGIMASAPVNLFDNLIRYCMDGIDYETGGSGEISGNIFRENRDDAIDLDGFLLHMVIRNNIIADNDDDGIEIRLHDYEGEYTFCMISGNVIYNNGEDGIQFIDYPALTHRSFLLERNLIYDNAMCGVACMDQGDTEEDFRGAPIPESIRLINNTILGHQYGVTGGANMVLLNNIIAGAAVTGIKNSNDNSIIAFNLLYENGTDMENSVVVGPGMQFTDPGLGEGFYPADDSPCIDNGTSLYLKDRDTVLHIEEDHYTGGSPDLGALEFDSMIFMNMEAREDSIELALALKEQARFLNVLYAESETEPVRSGAGEDAADDPAIWVNSEKPAESLVLGTNKKGGLYVYDLAGQQVQVREIGLVNNVDLRDGFQLNGSEVILVATSNRSNNSVTLLVIDKASGELSDSLLNIRSAVDEVYGICLYREPQGGFYVFVNGKGGRIEQWEIYGGESITASYNRSFMVQSQPEGMVVDDAAGKLFIGVEEEGIYLMDISSSNPVEMHMIPDSDSTNAAIAYDVEGLAFFVYQDRKFLLASSQGNFSYALFDITGDPRYLDSFIIAEGSVDGAEETDGIEITTASLPGPYREGLLVVQDGFNTDGETDLNQNFKYVSVSSILDLIR